MNPLYDSYQRKGRTEEMLAKYISRIQSKSLGIGYVCQSSPSTRSMCTVTPVVHVVSLAFPLITRIGPLRRQDLRYENHGIRYKYFDRSIGYK